MVFYFVSTSSVSFEAKRTCHAVDRFVRRVARFRFVTSFQHVKYDNFFFLFTYRFSVSGIAFSTRFPVNRMRSRRFRNESAASLRQRASTKRNPCLSAERRRSSSRTFLRRVDRFVRENIDLNTAFPVVDRAEPFSTYVSIRVQSNFVPRLLVGGGDRGRRRHVKSGHRHRVYVVRNTT